MPSFPDSNQFCPAILAVSQAAASVDAAMFMNSKIRDAYIELSHKNAQILLGGDQCARQSPFPHEADRG
jgi:hypothetical protein